MDIRAYIEKNKEAPYIFDAFKLNGFECYAVGGCIRDAILGIEPHDIDFCTNATPDQMKAIAKWIHKNYVHCEIVPVGEKFGTLAFSFPKTGIIYEITTYRKDGRYEDSRHPKGVSYTSDIIEDLKRRDFTCNAIAWNPDVGFVDPFKGIEDISRQAISCVGNPIDRFSEDALRIIRLLRFALKYEFDIDTKTLNAAKKLVENLNKVAKERLGKELVQIFNFKTFTNNSRKIVKLFWKILETITPVSMEDIDWILKFNNPLLKWYFVFNCDSEKIDIFVNNMNEFAIGSKIVTGCLNLRFACDFYNSCELEDVIKVLNYIKTSNERKAFLELKYCDSPKYEKVYKAIINNYAYSIKQLVINGDDVINITGIEPGPKVKQYLNQCLDAVITNQANNSKRFLTEYIKQLFLLDTSK